MRLVNYCILFGFLFLFSLPFVVAVNDLFALQGNVKQAGVNLASGNLTVVIFDAYSGGNIIYNSTGDFNNSIVDGKYDVMLGNGTHKLHLEYGKIYYMEVYINGEKFSFNGLQRQVFQSSFGQINATYINARQINSSHLVMNIDLSNATNISAASVNKSTGTTFVGQILDNIIDSIQNTITGMNVSWLSTYNLSYEGSLNNASYLTTYNESYHGLIQNTSYLTTYNESYHGLIQNISYLTTYNITYAGINNTGNIGALGFATSTQLNNTYLELTDNTLFLNFTPRGRVDFNGGWEDRGVSVISGDIYAQTLFVYNITSLGISNLNINGSLIPAGNGTFDNIFDIGNNTNRWRHLFVSGNANISQSLIATHANLSGNLYVAGVPFTSFIQNVSYLSTYNESYHGSLNNVSYLSTYNESYHGLIQNSSYLSTYNETYDGAHRNDSEANLSKLLVSTLLNVTGNASFSNVSYFFGANGSAEFGCRTANCWNGSNGALGFPGFGVAHGQIAFYPRNASFGFIDSSAFQPSSRTADLSTLFFRSSAPSLLNVWMRTAYVSNNITIRTLENNALFNLNATRSANAFRISNDTGPNYLYINGTTGNVDIGNVLNVSNNLFANGSNVGIGTSQPNQLLELSSASSSGTFLMINNTGGDDTGVMFRGDREYQFQNDGDGSLGTADYFHLRDDTAGAVRLTVDTAGRVGIGVADPDQSLEIANATGHVSIHLTSGSNNAYWAIPGSAGAFSSIAGVGETVLRADNGDLILTARSATGNITFTTEATDSQKAILTTGGRFGINTTTPNYNLEINSASTALNVSNFLFANRTNVGVGTSTPFRPLVVVQSADTTVLNRSGVIDIVGGPAGSVSVGSAAGINFHAYVSHPSPANVPHITLGERVIDTSVGVQSAFFIAMRDGNAGTSNMNEYFTILPNGSVGINSTNPGYALEVNRPAKGLNVSNLMFVNSTAAFFSNITNISRTVSVGPVAFADMGIGISNTTGQVGRVLMRQMTTNNIYVGDIDNNNGNVTFRAGGSDMLTLADDRGVGISSTNPSFRFEINNASHAMNVSNFFFANGSNVGIGTNNPQGSVLTIRATSDGIPAVYGINLSSITTGIPGEAYGIYAYAKSTTIGNSYGVYAESSTDSGTNAYGFYSKVTSPSSVNYGLYVNTTSTSPTVYGAYISSYSSSLTAPAYGIYVANGNSFFNGPILIGNDSNLFNIYSSAAKNIAKFSVYSEGASGENTSANIQLRKQNTQGVIDGTPDYYGLIVNASTVGNTGDVTLYGARIITNITSDNVDYDGYGLYLTSDGGLTHTGITSIVSGAGTPYGIRSEVYSTASGEAYGIYSLLNATTVLNSFAGGFVIPRSTAATYGVYAKVNGTSAVAVYGDTVTNALDARLPTGGTNEWAGWFRGNVTISGDLNLSAGDGRGAIHGQLDMVFVNSTSSGTTVCNLMDGLVTGISYTCNDCIQNDGTADTCSGTSGKGRYCFCEMD